MRALESFVTARRAASATCDSGVFATATSLRQRWAARVPHPSGGGKRAALAGLYDFGAREQQDQAAARVRFAIARIEQRAETATALGTEIE